MSGRQRRAAYHTALTHRKAGNNVNRVCIPQRRHRPEDSQWAGGLLHGTFNGSSHLRTLPEDCTLLPIAEGRQVCEGSLTQRSYLQENSEFPSKTEAPTSRKTPSIAGRQKSRTRLEKLLKEPDFLSLMVYLYFASHPSLVTPLSYNIEVIDVPSGTETCVMGINDKGEIVGFYHNPMDPPLRSSAFFRDSNKAYRTIAANSFASDINNAGQVLCYEEDIFCASGFGVYDVNTNTSSWVQLPGMLLDPGGGGINDRGTDRRVF